MSSSPTTAARAQPTGRPGLLTLFGSVPDPRHRRGVRHALPVILAVGLAAVLTGARSFAAIGEWVADQSGETLAALGADAGSRPSESTIRRVFARLDADLLDRVLGAYLWTRTRMADGRGHEEQRDPRRTTPAHVFRPDRCGGHRRCHAHPDRHRDRDHRSGRGLRVHRQEEPAITTRRG